MDFVALNKLQVPRVLCLRRGLPFGADDVTARRGRDLDRSVVRLFPRFVLALVEGPPPFVSIFCPRSSNILHVAGKSRETHIVGLDSNVKQNSLGHGR